jgi:hypothetical protein
MSGARSGRRGTASISSGYLPMCCDQVLTLREWCRLNSISLKTGQRIMAAGQGPVATQLSPNRIGVTIANNRAWQQSRERA